MNVPRSTGLTRLLDLGPVRQQVADLAAHHVARFGVLEVADDFRETEDAHGERREVDAVRQLLDAERHALLTGLEIGADGRQQQAEEHHQDAP